jgi:hypothetical protein
MEARKVPATHGWLWIRQAFELFRKSPLLWMILTAAGVVGMAMLAYIPVVGKPLTTILMPLLLGGFMIGARDLEHGRELQLPHLFAGVRHNAQELITLGGINLVARFLAGGAMIMLGGGPLIALITSGKQIRDPAVAANALTGSGLAIIVGATIFTLLVMAMQFAPMLVLFDHMKPLQAMKTSLRACLRNIIALILYGLTLLPFAIIASIVPLGLGWLVLMPILIASLYTIYVDVFPPQTGEPKTIEGEVISGDQPPQS